MKDSLDPITDMRIAVPGVKELFIYGFYMLYCVMYDALCFCSVVQMVVSTFAPNV